MNTSFYNKLSFAILIAGSLFLTSCGSSGGDDVYEFTNADLVNKYWYANPYLNQNYSTNDAVIVYRFSEDGDLVKQELSGRRDDLEAGSWNLSEDNVLTINDNTINSVQEWKIDKSSTRNHLFLKSIVGNRDFYSNVDELDDLTADAVIVKEVLLYNGQYSSRYRLEFEVKGDAISEVKAILSDSEKYDLVKAQSSKGEVVWRLNENDSKNYFDNFLGEKLVRFYVKMNSGEEYKLIEKIYNQTISALNYRSVKYEHVPGTGALTLSVEWEAIEDLNIYYYVEILNSEKDENNPLFTSNWQPKSSADIQSVFLAEKSKGEFGLSLEEAYYIKVVAFLYEENIDPFQGDISEFNVQARSIYIKSGGEW